MSRRLTALTESVGRKFALTPGRILQAADEHIETIVTEASLALRTAKDDVVGTARVSCPPGFVLHVLQALKTVCETYLALRCQVNGDYRTVGPLDHPQAQVWRNLHPSSRSASARNSGTTMAMPCSLET